MPADHFEMDTGQQVTLWDLEEKQGNTLVIKPTVDCRRASSTDREYLFSLDQYNLICSHLSVLYRQWCEGTKYIYSCTVLKYHVDVLRLVYCIAEVLLNAVPHQNHLYFQVCSHTQGSRFSVWWCEHEQHKKTSCNRRSKI